VTGIPDLFGGPREAHPEDPGWKQVYGSSSSGNDSEAHDDRKKGDEPQGLLSLYMTAIADDFTMGCTRLHASHRYETED